MRALLILFMATFFLACSNDDDATMVNTPNSWQPQKIKYTFQDVADESKTETFTYNSYGQLTYHNNPNYLSYEVFYTNGKVSRIDVYDSSGQLVDSVEVKEFDGRVEYSSDFSSGYHVFQFNENRTITEHEKYTVYDSGPHLFLKKTFIYKPGGFLNYIERDDGEKTYFFIDIEKDIENFNFGNRSGAYSVGLAHYLNLNYGKGLSSNYRVSHVELTQEEIDDLYTFIEYDFDEQDRVIGMRYIFISAEGHKTVFEY